MSVMSVLNSKKFYLNVVVGLFTAFVLLVTPINANGQDGELVYRNPEMAEISELGYTYGRRDGNRVVGGKGDLAEVSPVDIKLGGVPNWVAGLPMEKGYVWAVILEDGRVEEYRVGKRGRVSSVSIEPGRIPSEMPPLLALEDGKPVIVTPPVESASELTHPVVLDSSNRIAFIEEDGDLVVRGQEGTSRLNVNALPDARILVDENERLLFLTDPTNSYGHGVLGDEIEARSISLIETEGEPSLVSEITVPEGSVVEGTAPIWGDLTGDGAREIIVTVSNRDQGARIMVYSESGEVIGTGPAVGQGYRWRHQLALGPFGPQEEMELVDVLTPHIGGKVEYYRLNGESLDIVAGITGFTSHEIGSRNLDMAVAGDFDGNGELELLVPTETREELGGLRRVESGIEVAWRVSLGGKLATNIATVTTPEGELAVAVGRKDRRLRIWLPEKS